MSQVGDQLGLLETLSKLMEQKNLQKMVLLRTVPTWNTQNHSLAIETIWPSGGVVCTWGVLLDMPCDVFKSTILCL